MSTDYFQAYEQYFWQLEGDSDALVFAIPAGHTIAYTASLKDVFKGIEDQGLPPFGTLLLSVIALNSTANEDLAKIKWILASYGDIDSGNVADGLLFLSLLSKVPAKYKSGTLKVALLRSIFEKCHNIISVKNSSIATEHLLNNGVYSQLKKVNQACLSADFRPLSILNKKYKTVEDILSKASRFPVLKDDITLESRAEEESTDFIEELKENTKTNKIGVLVKTVCAGLNLPVHSSLKSEQALGGVADLTNKGNYDQLLISEYANEDIVFLSRLANNEALYLSKETPPISNDLKRVILIDVSLKNWGTPKLISFAVMTAIAQLTTNQVESEVYLVGDQVTRVAHTSVLGIISALQVVEPSINFVSGIKQYFEDNRGSKEIECFVLTEESGFNDKEVLNVFSEYKRQINYLVTNNEIGDIDIYRNLKNGRKHLQHLHLNLTRLWQSKVESKTNKVFTNKNVLGVKDVSYPILVPQNLKSIGVKKANNGDVYQLTKDRSLLRHKDPLNYSYLVGWEVLYQGLDASIKDFDIGVCTNGDVILLTFNVQRKQISLLNLTTKEEIKVPFIQWWFHKEEVFAFENGNFYFGNDFTIWRINEKGKLFTPPNEKAYLIQKKRQENEDLQKDFRVNKSVLKNIKELGISSDSKLFLNKHKLELFERGVLAFHVDPVNRNEKEIYASKESSNIFNFADGSKVIVNKNGFLTLISSDHDIPELYISTALEDKIGVATKTEFAGNIFFKNGATYDVRLNNAGSARLALVKKIKEITDLSLKECQEIIESIPSSLMLNVSLDKAQQFFNQIYSCGAEAEIIPLQDDFLEDMVTIESNEFYVKYIDQFIQKITSYEAKS